MSERDTYGPLPSAVVKGLGDKLYDKRKNAALEVEKLVKQLLANKNNGKVVAVISVLRKEFVFNNARADSRKGGLIAMAAVALALSQHLESIGPYLTELVPPVLSCFADPDPRVRYFACEAMYNISKVARSDVLVFFNRIFDGLSKLSADPDPNVKSGSEMLDRLMKDVVTEHPNVNIENFIPLLRERIFVENPHTRMFLVSWISVLDSVPEIDMLSHLPEFLDGLFKILSDFRKEIRTLCLSVLSEFLRELMEAPSVNCAAMMPALTAYCSCNDAFSKVVAVTWVNEFIKLCGAQMLPFISELLRAILPSVSAKDDPKLRELAMTANQSLMKLVVDSDPKTDLKDFDFSPTLNVLTMQLDHQAVNTRLAALRWMLMLRDSMPAQMYEHVDELAPALLKSLSDTSDKVVKLDLEVLAELSSADEGESEERQEQADLFFKRFMLDLVSMFDKNRELLTIRGSFIVRNLCLLLEAEKLYRAFAGILIKEVDLEFAPLMVQNLNLILLTAPELEKLRRELMAMASPESFSLFVELYKSWCHSPVATLALCLLAQVYDHACELLDKFAWLEVTVELLVEVDKLIQLIESPIFTYLRLQLLQPNSYAHLIKCLYGLLMLLPQTTAYATLRNRLDCIPVIASTLAPLDPPSKKGGHQFKGNVNKPLPYGELLARFDEVQKQHVLERRTSK